MTEWTNVKMCSVKTEKYKQSMGDNSNSLTNWSEIILKYYLKFLLCILTEWTNDKICNGKTEKYIQ